jgi:hypothetical protein
MPEYSRATMIDENTTSRLSQATFSIATAIHDVDRHNADRIFLEGSLQGFLDRNQRVTWYAIAHILCQRSCPHQISVVLGIAVSSIRSCGQLASNLARGELS